MKLVFRLHMTFAMFLQDYLDFFSVKHHYAILNHAKGYNDIPLVKALIDSYQTRKREQPDGWLKSDEKFLRVAIALLSQLEKSPERQFHLENVQTYMAKLKCLTDNDFFALKLLLPYMKVTDAELIIKKTMKQLTDLKEPGLSENLYYVVDNDYGSQLTDDKWALPEDWDIASPRRGNIPEVVWQMMSVGDGINYMIEPVNQKEGIISGFINPTYTIEVTLVDPLTDKVISILEVEVDENGYFSIDAEVISDAVPMIKIFDENSNLVFEEALKIYHYEPTELTHESGLLTLDRYFIDQPYMEVFSYPHAKVTIVSLTSDGFVTLEPVIADEYGYFYSETPAHETNLTTNIASVEHPDTKETVTVAPYPWTQEELEKVNQ